MTEQEKLAVVGVGLALLWWASKPARTVPGGEVDVVLDIGEPVDRTAYIREIYGFPEPVLAPIPKEWPS